MDTTGELTRNVELTELDRKLYWKDQLKNYKDTKHIMYDYRDGDYLECDMKSIEGLFDDEINSQMTKITRGKREAYTIFQIALLGVFLYRFYGNCEAFVWMPEEDDSSRYMIHRIGLDGKKNFKEILSQTFGVFKNNAKVKGLPYEVMCNILNTQLDGEAFDKSFIMLDTSGGTERATDLPACGLYFAFRNDSEKGIFQLYYNSGLYDENTAKTVLHNYSNLLRQILENMDIAIEELDVVSQEDRKTLLENWMREGKGYPIHKSLPELFQEQVMLAQDHVAARTLSNSITYRELDDKSGLLARYLCQHAKAENSQFIAVLMERSIEFVVSMLAIMKSGKAYLPIQPNYPWERVKYMLDDSSVTTVFTTKTVLDSFKDSIGQCAGVTDIICIDEKVDFSVENKNIVGMDDIECDDTELPHVSAEDLAYMIYTSGTTGNPKGVMIRHNSAINHIYAEFDDLKIDKPFTFLQSAPSSSDISVWQFWAPLCVGGTTAIIEKQDLLYMPRLFQYIIDADVTIVEFVPQLLREFLHYAEENSRENELAERVQYVIATGETIPVDLVNRFFDIFPGKKLINAYGPTEAADDVIQEIFDHKVADNLLRLSIGRPLKNIKVYILNEKKELLPIGVVGEIFISGIALSPGYWNNEEKNAEKFVPNPYEPGSFMYCTGDLGAWRADGTIDFFGRNDYQVKINGYRIELDEIDSILMKCELVRQAVSVVKRSQQTDSKAIVSYVEVEKEDSLNEIYEYVNCHIPQYMKPGRVVILDRIPTNHAGKFDRSYLEACEDEGEEKNKRSEKYSEELANSEIAINLLEIWRAVFKNEQIDIYDDFFALGGDSIISIQLSARAEQQGIFISPKEIFEGLTIAEIVLNYESQKQTETDDNTNSYHDEIMLSPIQKWFFAQHYEVPEHFNQTLLLDIDPRITAEMISDALLEIVNHHEMLRAYYVWENGSVIQKCLEKVETISLNIHDLSDNDINHNAEQIYEISGKYQKDIELDKPLLERFVLFREGKGKQKLLIVIHHLVVDGVSWRIIAEDLDSALQQKLKGNEIHLAGATTSYQAWYKEISEQWKKDSAIALLKKWNHNSEEVKRSMELLGCERGQVRSIDFEIDQESTKKIDMISRMYNVNIQEVLLAILTEVLHELFDLKAMQIDLEGIGRESEASGKNVTRTIGWFTALTPIVLEYRGQEDFCVRAKRIKKQIDDKNGISFGMLGYEETAEELKEMDMKGIESPIRFNFLGTFDLALPAGALFSLASDTIADSYSDRNCSRYLLDINTGVNQRKLYFNMLYNANGMSAEKADEIRERIITFIDGICARQFLEYSLWGFDAEIEESAIYKCFPDQSDIEDIYPMTSMQQAIMTHNIMHSRQEYSKQSIQNTIRGELDPDAFEKAWDDVIGIHPLLRTTFRWRNVPVPIQIVHRNCKCDFKYIDCSSLSEEQQADEMASLVEQEKKAPFDMSKLPLIRFRLLKVGEQCYEFYVYYSTSLFDNWSWKIVMKDFLHRYDVIIHQKSDEQIQERGLVDYVKYVTRNQTNKCAVFWKRELAGFQNISVQEEKSKAAKFIPLNKYGEVSEETTKEIVAFCKKNSITMNSLLQLAWALSFCHMLETNDVVYGILSSGRPSSVKNCGELVGPMSNLIPTRFILQENDDVITCVKRMQMKQIEMISYDWVSLQQIADYLEVKTEDIQGIINEKSLILMDEGGIEGENVNQQFEIVNSDVFLFHRVPFRGYASVKAKIEMHIKYDAERINSQFVDRFIDFMMNTLEKMMRNPEQDISELRK